MIELLLLLLMKSGRASPVWSITFENRDYCALKGSSVEFMCSYSYPDEETVRETSWYKGEVSDGIWIRRKLSHIPSYQNRSEYRGDLQHNCNLALHDLQENDTGYYYVWFDTNRYGRRSQASVYLSVTELNARVYPQRVKAGDNVTLECEASCQLPNIIWYRDGLPVEKTEFQVQTDDAGHYACTVEGYEFVQSNSVTLDILYSPMNMSVDVSHTGLLTAGSSVNLTCSSAAKPAADVYTWYKMDVSNSTPPIKVGSEQVLSLFYMEASHYGLYFCQARNQVGEGNSSEVLLTVEEEGMNRFIVLGIGIKLILVLLLPLVIFLICRWWRNSAADKENDSNDYENISITECVSEQLQTKNQG